MRVLDLAAENFTVKPVGNGIWQIVSNDGEFSSIRIWEDTNSWYRYSQSKGGGPREFMLYVLGMDRDEVDKQLPPEEKNPLYKRLKSLSKTEAHSISYYDLLGQKIYHPYFIERNINEETVKHFELEVRENGIVFPIWDLYGKRIGSQIRLFHAPSYARYSFLMLDGHENPPIWPIKNWDINFDETIILTEGNFSLCRIHQVLKGRLNNIRLATTHGSNVNETIIKYLYGKNVIYLGDNDESGLKNVEKLKRVAYNNFKLETYLPLFPLDDMDDDSLLAFLRDLYKTTFFCLSRKIL